jgi:hypothetical protein
MESKMKPERIKNLKGFLCRSFDDKYFFRTYNEDGTFSDYKLCHSDLEIQILDTDAYIYNRNGEFCIDHSPKTLGIETESE